MGGFGTAGFDSASSAGHRLEAGTAYNPQGHAGWQPESTAGTDSCCYSKECMESCGAAVVQDQG